jgi:hypothetical protein
MKTYDFFYLGQFGHFFAHWLNRQCLPIVFKMSAEETMEDSSDSHPFLVEIMPKEETIDKKAKEPGEFKSLYHEYRKHADKFFGYTKVTIDTFDYILFHIQEDVEMYSNIKSAIPAEKLFLTLR